MHYKRDGKTLLRVLTVADSYYDQRHFADRAPLEREQVSLAQELDQQDVVILLSSDGSLPRLGWGFLENVDDLVTLGAVRKPPRAAPLPD